MHDTCIVYACVWLGVFSAVISLHISLYASELRNFGSKFNILLTVKTFLEMMALSLYLSISLLLFQLFAREVEIDGGRVAAWDGLWRVEVHWRFVESGVSLRKCCNSALSHCCCCCSLSFSLFLFFFFFYLFLFLFVLFVLNTLAIAKTSSHLYSSGVKWNRILIGICS